jgi:uncharacterized protein (DUF2164 family)
MQNNTEKYIGVVKWFHDAQRKADYGFIQHTKLGEVYFNESSILEGQSKEKFSENNIVVFKSRQSTRKRNSLEAFDVTLIRNEKNIIFLFSHFLSSFSEKENYNDYNLLQRSVFQAIQKLYLETPASEKTELIKMLKDFISNNKLDYQKAKAIFTLIQLLLKDNEKELISHLLNYLDKETNYMFWLDKVHNEPNIDFIISKIILSEINERKIFQRCDDKLKVEIFSKLIFDLELVENKVKIDEIIKIFNLCEKYYKESYYDIIGKIIAQSSNSQKTELIDALKQIISSRQLDYQKAKSIFNLIQSLFKDTEEEMTYYLIKYLDKEVSYQLWLDKIHNKPDIDFITNQIIVNENNQQKIFERSNNQVKNEIFFKLIFDLGLIENEQKVDEAIKVFSLCTKYYKVGYSEVSEKIVEQSSSYIKLSFWLKEFTEYFNYDEFVIYTITLSIEEQKIFFKKVIKLIHEQKISLKLIDLERIMTVDLKLYEELNKDEDKLNDLDFTICIVLQIIRDLANEVRTKRETIFEIIANQVKKPTNLLKIKGFFDECKGRTIAKVTPILDEEGKHIDKTVEFKLLEEKPRFAIYCDGRKSPSKCNKTDLDFWWCENSQCYNPERKIRSSEEWKDYSLLDILTILNINFIEKEYEILLSVINKANRFLDHLICRECEKILHPKGKSNFSFWGVSNFHCKNENCSKNEQDIYISHCMNGKCEDIIDARDCAKCKPKGFEDCGWYVCNFCNSCCDTPKLEKRKWVYENIFKTEYKCHLKGHRNLGEMCCNKCGVIMSSNKFSKEQFDKTLNWFIENKDKNQYIKNSGNRKNDKKWWFTFAQNEISNEKYREKLTNLLKIGFNIPDYEDENKSLQLIAEPFFEPRGNINIFDCSNCGNTIDLSKDLDRYKVMQGFHVNLFPAIAQ